MAKLLEIRDVAVTFPSRRGAIEAARGVSLEVDRGEILGVVGESGAGKSTIGGAVMGLLEPPGRLSAGEVRLSGARIDNLPEEEKRKLRGKRIGMIFQDPLTALDPLQTVGAQLVETIRAHGERSASRARERAIDMLRQVGIAEPELSVDHYPHQFSGGMRQRVVIALALCAGPELLIADEPTTALDVAIQAQILELLKTACRDEGLGMIVITHDMGVIAEIADRVAVMLRGEIVETGSTARILSAPEHPYSRSLIGAAPRGDRRLKRFPVVDFSSETIARPREVDLATHWLGRGEPHGATAERPLLEVSDLSLRFVTRRSLLPSRRRWRRAVDGVSFEIARGETFGLVGASGSGKSTIARIVAGLARPDHGSVRFDGAEVASLRSAAERQPYRREIQMIFQDPYSSLNPRMRAGAIVAEPIEFHDLAANRAEARAIAGDLLEIVGLGAEAAVRYPHEFSGGQRQRISIARALATRPRFLICDEPTSALDVSIQAQILNLLKDLQERLGLTMLFISHDLPVVRQMCDRIAVLRDGAVRECAPAEQLFEAPRDPYTRELLALTPKLPNPA